MLKTVSVQALASSGAFGNLTVSDGTNSVVNVTTVTFSNNATVGGSTPSATVTIPSLTVTDNTTTINNVTNITFNGGKISGNSVSVIVNSPTSNQVIAAATANINPGVAYTNVTGAVMTLANGTWVLYAQTLAFLSNSAGTLYSRIFNVTDSANITGTGFSSNAANFNLTSHITGYVTIPSGSTKVIALQTRRDSAANWTVVFGSDGNIPATGISAIKLS